MTFRRRLASLGLALLATSAPLPTAAVDAFPVSEIRPGMKGVGRTVFEGTRIDEFQVEILGVLENVLGPGGSVILARLEGGPLEKTGVIAGMSGSPVFIDGKLLGAVAYSFPFAKETIGGITPFAEMIAATSVEAPRAASARFAPRYGPQGPALPLDRQALLSALKRPLPAVVADPGSFRGALPPGLAGASLQALSVPLVFSGFDPAVLEWARPLFAGLGFTPVAGAGTGAALQEAPALAPGSAVGVSLVEGDFDLSSTGTVTAVDGERIYAFGHPFFNLGPTQFPLRKAFVYSVFPSLYSSFKITAPLDVVGTMDQDRSTAIAGRLGAPPPMIPVKVALATSRGQERRYAFRVVEDELLSPVLAFISVLSALQGSERAFGTATIKVSARVQLKGGREVRVEDLFAEEQPSVQASALVAAPLAYLMSNDFERVTVEGLTVEVASQETVQTAAIQRAWLERSGPIRPGAAIPLKVLLRTYRGETRTETIPLRVPPNAADGTYALLVSDAAAMTSLEQREMRQPFVPRDLDQLVRAINGLRRNNHLYARLLRPDAGAIVGGEYMQSLPPSVLSVLGSGDPGIVPIRTASVWDFDLATPFALSGSRLLSVTVER
ncbi:MAG TPA: SpoIVB peptidase S55 domain-containing protein [Vicinamibacteria bacterium]|nr:SpoIVB peptidase S55 domain-containing protein [Vicinamibacteria bacterium]